MSADSSKRLSKSVAATVRPQPYSDKSVVESVVDFFQDVAYSQNSPKTDEKEKIQWVRFENADVNDVNNNPDCSADSSLTAPLLMVIGYSNGMQMWTVSGNGEGQEVLSLRQGPVRIVRVLPTPLQDSGQDDKFKNKRPLIALVDASSAGQPYCSVKFVSLRSGDEVHNLPFSYSIIDIQCNTRVMVVAFKENLAVFDALQYKQMFWVTSCYPSPGPSANPISLGDRWLAYADKKLVPVHQSGGGVSGDCGQSYAATVISAAKTVTKGLTMFGQTVASSLTGTKSGPVKKEPTTTPDNRYRPGIVTIVDVLKVKESQLSVRDDMDGEGLVAHFPAHPTEPVYALQFDPSGLMLLTADKLGHNFHLFRVMAHPLSCSQGAVHHLYTLYRGDTTAKVQDIAFTSDSRWVAVSSLRGTTHVFPITPYGGTVNVRTHTSSRVVNRASRFHRSAGLEDMPHGQSGRDSPVPGSGSPSSSPRQQSEHYRQLNAINNIHTASNPRLPPYPHPTIITALVHIRQKVSIPGLGGSGTAASAGKSSASQARQQAAQLENVCVAAKFAKSRGWVAGSPGFSSNSRDKEKPKAVDSLYILSWTGILVEHILEPHSKATQDKVTDESPLEVLETPRAQWLMGRYKEFACTLGKPELRPPLPSNNPLIEACDAILSQKQTESLSRQESKESLSSDGSSQDFYQQWVSQVEINTHTGPHRRLWMGPQFSFKTFQGSSNVATVLSSHSSVLLSHSPEQHVSTMDIVKDDVDLHSLEISPTRSSPVAMPPGCQSRRSESRHTSGSERQCPSPGLQTFIEAGSYDHSPTITDPSCEWPESQLPTGDVGDSELLQQSLADAMSEMPAKEGSRHQPTAHRTSLELDAGPPSFDNLSTSSGSASSAPKILTFDARASPHQCFDHVLVFPSNDSTDGSQ